jgi:hypothetical protein
MATALLLAEQGGIATVIERVAAPDAVGAGVVLQPNGRVEISSSQAGRKGGCGPAAAGHGSMVTGWPVAVCHSAVRVDQPGVGIAAAGE